LMVDVANHLARALIAVYGAEAMSVATRAAARARQTGQPRKVKMWDRVIVAIDRRRTLEAS
jgi:hypothetical protein